MKATRYFGVPAALLLLASWLTVGLGAHELPLEVLTYVKADGNRLRVLVRVPPEFLRDAGLPVRSDGYLDLRDLGAPAGPLSAIVSDVARNLDVMQAGEPLKAPQASWTVSLLHDASFDTYEAAVARIAAPPFPVDATINPTAALVDVQLDYPIDSRDSRFSVRVNGYRANRPSRMQVRYVTPAGGTRTLITSGAPRRIELEPRWQTTGLMFARLGIEQLTQAALPLFFLLCLAIPPRPMRTTLAAFGTFAISCTGAVVLATWLPGPPDQSLGGTFQRLAAAMLVVAALQNIVTPRFVWVRVVSAGLGLAIGVVLGLVYRANAPFAGTHTIVSLLSFGGPILLGWLWLLLVAQPVVGLVRGLTLDRATPAVLVGPDPTGSSRLVRLEAPNSGLRGRWAIILLSAIVIHAALHGILVGP